jgi:hypothetical protein
MGDSNMRKREGEQQQQQHIPASAQSIAFFQQTDVPALPQWYDKDFSTGGDAGILAWIIRNLPEGDAKRLQLEGLVKAGKAKVKHLEYDWGLNKK